MRTRFLPLERLDQRDERAWRGLAERSAEANPFFEPEFVLPAARHLGPRGGGLLVAEAGSEWVACIPVNQHVTKLQVPVLSGWRTPYSFLGTPLVAEGAERELPRLLEEAQRGRLTGVTMLDQISRESPAWRAIEDSIGREEVVALVRRDFDRAAFAPTGRSPELPLSSRRRADLRRTRRRLEERLGGEVEMVSMDVAARRPRVPRPRVLGLEGRRGHRVRRTRLTRRVLRGPVPRLRPPGAGGADRAALRRTDRRDGHDARRPRIALRLQDRLRRGVPQAGARRPA